MKRGLVHANKLMSDQFLCSEELRTSLIPLFVILLGTIERPARSSIVDIACSVYVYGAIYEILTAVRKGEGASRHQGHKDYDVRDLHGLAETKEVFYRIGKLHECYRH